MSTRHEDAEAIARDLARELGPAVKGRECPHCYKTQATGHERSCVWLRAVLWVSGGEQ